MSLRRNIVTSVGIHLEPSSQENKTQTAPSPKLGPGAHGADWRNPCAQACRHDPATKVHAWSTHWRGPWTRSARSTRARAVYYHHPWENYISLIRSNSPVHGRAWSDDHGSFPTQLRLDLHYFRHVCWWSMARSSIEVRRLIWHGSWSYGHKAIEELEGF